MNWVDPARDKHGRWIEAAHHPLGRWRVVGAIALGVLLAAAIVIGGLLVVKGSR